MLFRSAALGLCCCARDFFSCSEQGLLFIAVPGFSLRWLLLLRSTGSRRVGFSSCGSRALGHRLSNCGKRAYLLCSMWDLPGPGLKPVSPALAGGFLTTVPPGKPGGCFNRKEKEIGRAIVNQESMAFHWLSPWRKGIFFSYWALLSLQGVRAPLWSPNSI